MVLKVYLQTQSFEELDPIFHVCNWLGHFKHSFPKMFSLYVFNGHGKQGSNVVLEYVPG